MFKQRVLLRLTVILLCAVLVGGCSGSGRTGSGDDDSSDTAYRIVNRYAVGDRCRLRGPEKSTLVRSAGGRASAFYVGGRDSPVGRVQPDSIAVEVDGMIPGRSGWVRLSNENAAARTHRKMTPLYMFGAYSKLGTTASYAFADAPPTTDAQRLADAGKQSPQYLLPGDKSSGQVSWKVNENGVVVWMKLKPAQPSPGFPLETTVSIVRSELSAKPPTPESVRPLAAEPALPFIATSPFLSRECWGPERSKPVSRSCLERVVGRRSVEAWLATKPGGAMLNPGC